MVHTPTPPQPSVTTSKEAKGVTRFQLPSPQPPSPSNVARNGYQRTGKQTRQVSLQSPTRSASPEPPKPAQPEPEHPEGPPSPLAPVSQMRRIGTLGNLSEMLTPREPEPGHQKSAHFDDGWTNPTSHQHEGAAALCTAASEGDEVTLAALLETGYPVNKGDYDRRTALHLAAEEGHLGCVEVLVEYGADVNCRDRWGTTPLKGAVHNLHNEVANYLRDHGAKLQDDAADTSMYQTNKRQARVWFDRALQFCGLAPDTDFLPMVGLAGYLYVEHGINVHKHKAIAQELAPLRHALRTLRTGDSEQDLKKWLSVGDKWAKNCMPPAPPQIKFTKQTQKVAQEGRARGRDFESQAGQSLCGMPRFEKSMCSGGVDTDCPSPTPGEKMAASDSGHPFRDLAKEFPQLAIESGVPPALAQKLYEMLGRSICTFPEFVTAIIGEEPTSQREGKDGNAGKERRPKVQPADSTIKAPHLQTIALGRLQVPNWRSFVESVLELAARVLDGSNEGKNADYIPELSEEKIDPNIFGVAICTVDGQQLAIGDTGDFTIQSCGKPFVYAQSVEEYGQDFVHSYVGQEPSGRAFNDFALTPKGQPFNAVTNAGAMMTASLYHPEETLQDRTVRYMGKVRRLSGEDHISVDEAVYKSEQGTAYRNHAIANFMMSEGCYPEQVGTMDELHRHVDFYLRTCAIRLNCQTLANMAATLANYGVCAVTGDKVLAFATVKQALQLAFSCGMYNSSGEWACTVGIPAKSGVSGAIWLAVPGVLGVCVRSPRLDSIGNSVRGVRFSRQFAERFQWGVMDLLYRAKDNLKSLS